MGPALLQQVRSTRLLRALAGVTAILAATACGSSPSGPTAALPAAAALSGAAPNNAPADFWRCLSGSGEASCFTASNVRTAAVNATALVNSAPRNLTATVSGNTAFLTWSAPLSGDPPTDYILEAGSAPGSANFFNARLLSTATSLIGDAPPGTYYVRVRAVNAAGVSGPSNEIIVLLGATSCAGPPRNLAFTSPSPGSVTLTWASPATGAPVSYWIRAGSTPGQSDLADFDTNSSSVTFSASNVPGGSYYTRVYSKSGCGLSAPSNEIVVLIANSGGDVQVSVSWDAPSDVDLHVLEPSGEEIYFGHPTSATGGQLDVDSNAECTIDGRQAENVAWGSRAPAGTYTVRLEYWSSCGVARTNYVVSVKNGSSTLTFNGSFTGGGEGFGAGSGRLITTFVHAASDVTASRFAPQFRVPSLFTPSAHKLRLSGAAQ